MFGDLGLTVVFSLLASLAVALFFIPMLASRQGQGEPDDRGLWGGLADLWRGWNSIKDVRELVGNFRWWMVLLLPYYLFRFAVHLFFELAGRLIWTGLLLVWAPGRAVFAGVKTGGGYALWPVLAAFDWLLNLLSRVYTGVIRFSLKNTVVVLVVAAGTVVGGLVVVEELDSELIPELHQGELTVEMTFPVGTPLDDTDVRVVPVEQRLREAVPRLRADVVSVGSERDDADDGDKGEHTAEIKISLLAGGGQAMAAQMRGGESESESESTEEGTTRGQEGQGAPAVDPATAEEEALAVIREVVATVPDVQLKVSRPVLFSFKTPVEVEIRGYELKELGEATEAVRARLARVEGLRDVSSSILPGNPEVQIVYDRDALARLNLDVKTVAELVRDKVQGYEATKFNRKDRKIPVRVRLKDVDQAGVAELKDLVVNPGGGRPIPLSAVANVSVGRGPNEIRRVGQQRVGLVTANLEGVGLGSVTSTIREALEDLDLPDTVSTAVTGQSEEWETSSSSMYLALALSVFLVYVIMASQFESLAYPLIILVSIPLAMVGVVLGLWVTQTPLSVVVFLGVIMLAGIVVNNAIVLVDYVNQLKARGHDTAEALELAGQVRLRPILMTTLTTVLGLVPMAMGLGDGAEIRQPMAVAVIFGLAFSTVLTLVVIPTLYNLVDRLFSGRAERSPARELDEELAGLDDRLLEPEESGLAIDGEGEGEAEA